MSIKEQLVPFLRFISEVSEDHHAIAQILSDMYGSVVKYADTLASDENKAAAFSGVVQANYWRATKADPDLGNYYRIQQLVAVSDQIFSPYCALTFSKRSDPPKPAEDEILANADKMGALYGEYIKRLGSYAAFGLETKLLIECMLKDWVVAETASCTYSEIGMEHTVDGRAVSEHPEDEMLFIYFVRKDGSAPMPFNEAVLMLDVGVIYKAVTASYLGKY